MGYHTWFSEPKNEDNRSIECIRAELLEVNRLAEAEETIAEWKKYYRRVKKLIPSKFSVATILKMSWYEWKSYKGFYYQDLDANEYHDTFRVTGYTDTILESLDDVVDFCSKRAVNLNKVQLEKLNSFFNDYPKGIIYFG